jgi:hypothetical protein
MLIFTNTIKLKPHPTPSRCNEGSWDAICGTDTAIMELDEAALAPMEFTNINLDKQGV